MPELFFDFFYRGVSISWRKLDFVSLKNGHILIAWQPYSFSPTHVHNFVVLLALLSDQSLKVWLNINIKHSKIDPNARLIKNLVDLRQNELSVYSF